MLTDRFVEVMIEIAKEIETDPEKVRNAPHTTPVIRPDEARAARQLRVKWTPTRDDG